jgi:hypothetical protein
MLFVTASDVLIYLIIIPVSTALVVVTSVLSHQVLTKKHQRWVHSRPFAGRTDGFEEPNHPALPLPEVQENLSYLVGPTAKSAQGMPERLGEYDPS